jgi:hypothetical protein
MVEKQPLASTLKHLLNVPNLLYSKLRAASAVALRKHAAL